MYSTNPYDFGRPSNLTEDVRDLYQMIYETKDQSKKKHKKAYSRENDQDDDGDNDGADVMIARMVASGMSREEAIRRTQNKSYNKEAYNYEQLAVLALVNEGYASDLRSAQAIYENASSSFKKSLIEFVQSSL